MKMQSPQEVPIEVQPLSPEEQSQLEEWQAGAHARARAEVEEARFLAYQRLSDPIMAQWLRGEKTEQEWRDAVQLVKDTYPYPETPIS